MKNLFLTLILVTASCSTMSKKECQNADWWELGFSDLSQHGRNNSYYNTREKACSKHKVASSENAYMKGWNEAISTYCTNETIYSMGVKGTTFLNICSEDKYQELLSFYTKGRKVYEINLQIKQINNEITNIENLRDQKDVTAIEKSQFNRKIELLKSDIRMLGLEKLKYKF